MNNTQHYFPELLLLLVENVFTCSKSISLSGISAIKTGDPKLPSAYIRKLKSQSSAGPILGKNCKLPQRSNYTSEVQF